MSNDNQSTREQRLIEYNRRREDALARQQMNEDNRLLRDGVDAKDAAPVPSPIEPPLMHSNQVFDNMDINPSQEIQATNPAQNPKKSHGMQNLTAVNNKKVNENEELEGDNIELAIIDRVQLHESEQPAPDEPTPLLPQQPLRAIKMEAEELTTPTNAQDGELRQTNSVSFALPMQAPIAQSIVPREMFPGWNNLKLVDEDKGVPNIPFSTPSIPSEGTSKYFEALAHQILQLEPLAGADDGTTLDRKPSPTAALAEIKGDEGPLRIHDSSLYPKDNPQSPYYHSAKENWDPKGKKTPLTGQELYAMSSDREMIKPLVYDLTPDKTPKPPGVPAQLEGPSHRGKTHWTAPWPRTLNAHYCERYPLPPVGCAVGHPAARWVNMMYRRELQARDPTFTAEQEERWFLKDMEVEEAYEEWLGQQHDGNTRNAVEELAGRSVSLDRNNKRSPDPAPIIQDDNKPDPMRLLLEKLTDEQRNQRVDQQLMLEKLQEEREANQRTVSKLVDAFGSIKQEIKNQKEKKIKDNGDRDPDDGDDSDNDETKEPSDREKVPKSNKDSR